MHWLQTQMLLLDAATATVQFAANWILQSALLIMIGLVMGRILAARGSAVQSAVYRTTLAAVLVCPLASLLLSLAGVSGWSLSMPQSWTYAEVEAVAANVPALQPAPPSPAVVTDAPLPAQMSTVNNRPQPPVSASEPGVSDDPGPVVAEASLPTVQEEPIASIAAPPTTPPTFSFSIHVFGWLALGLSAAWLLISTVLAGGLCLAWWRLSRLRRGALPADDAICQICRELAAQLSVAPPQVLRSPYLPSPCLAGIRRPIVLLPEAELSLSIRDVLIHELAHLRRRDCHWNLLRHLALSTLFFQPLLWMLSRRLEATAEEVCDDFVVQLGGDRHEYAHRLIDIAELSTAPMAAAGVGIVSLRSMLARRVVRIMDTSRSLSTRAGSLLLALVLVGGIFGTMIVGLVGIGPQQSAAEPAVATASDDQAAIAGDEPADAAVSGRVTLPDGKPAAGARVAVIAASVQPARKGERLQPGEALAEGIADEAGNYRLSLNGFSSKTHVHANVIARKDGYAIAWQEFNIDAPATEADLILSARQPIRGRLVDIEGQPAVGVRLLIQAVSRTKPGQNTPQRTADGGRSEGVYYYRGDNFPAAWIAPVVSDAQGRFALNEIPVGHGVSLTAEGNDRFAPQEIALNTGLAEVGGEPGFAYQPYWPLVRNMGAGEEALIPLAPAQWFEGLVTYEDSGQPIPHAQLTIWAHQKKENGGFSGVSGKADVQGRYRINPNPGVLFHIEMYPPDGTPYLARQFGSDESILWQAGDRVKQVNLKLPRGVLVRGTIVEAGTKTPVAGATVQYFPEDATTARAPAGNGPVLTGGNAAQFSNAKGEFAIAVLPGPGRLLVRAAQDKYIFYETSEREFRDGSPGGKRNYAHAIEKIDPVTGAAPIELSVSLRPATTVAGLIVDETGKKLDQARVISNLQLWPEVFYWLGDPTPPTTGGRFELSGLAPDRDYPVYFLEPGRQLGARQVFRADSKSTTVVLKPCGQATARLVDDKGRPRVSIAPYLHMVVTPSAWPAAPSAISAGIDALVNKVVAPDEMQYDMAAGRLGRLAADEDYLANIDPTNYQPGPASDAKGRITFPALIPGVTYQLHGYYNNKILTEFSVKSGEHLDLGNIQYLGGKPRAAQQMEAAVGADKAPDGNPAASRDAALADDEPIITSGRVLDAAGKPVAGATVRLVWQEWNPQAHRPPLVETRSDTEGRFDITYRKSQLKASAEQSDEVAVSAFKQGYGRDWVWRRGMPPAEHVELRLPDDDPAITGRLVDLEGRPLAGVRVECGMLSIPKGDDLSAWIEAIKLGEGQPTAKRYLRDLLLAEGAGLAPELVTDRDGRFRVTGVGRERIIDLVFEGPTIVRTTVTAVTRKMPSIADPNARPSSYGAIFGADFELALPPTRVIEGVVRDAKTGATLAGVGIESWKFSGRDTIGVRDIRTVSDAEGRFRLVGMAKGPGNEILAIPNDDQPYLMREVEVSDEPGIAPVQVEVELHRGIWITGRVTNQVTGEPLRTQLQYWPFLSNEYARNVPEFGAKNYVDGMNGYPGRYHTAADGSYRLVGLPGRAIVAVVANRELFIQGHRASDIQEMTKQGNFLTYLTNFLPNGKNWPTEMKEIDPAEKTDSVQLDFALDPGKQVEIAMVDPAGQPLTEVMVIGPGMSSGGLGRPCPTGTFVVTALGPEEERTILLRQEARGLGKVVRVRAEDGKGKITVQLAPCAKIVGRVVDSNEVPIARADVNFIVLPDKQYKLWLPVRFTDADGKFQQPDVLPGAKYEILALGSEKQRMFHTIARELSVEPGETIDLGTIDVTGDKRPEPLRTKAAAVAVAEASSDAIAKDSPAQEFAGKVVDPTGRPVAGAELYLIYGPRPIGLLVPTHKPVTATDSSGAFRFTVNPADYQASSLQLGEADLVAVKPGFGFAWSTAGKFETSGKWLADVRTRLKAAPPKLLEDLKQKLAGVGEPLKLVVDDQPIRGRIVDINGQPVKGARLTLLEVLGGVGDDLAAWRKATKQSKADYYSARTQTPRSIGSAQVLSLAGPTVTGDDGHFTLPGIGRGRIAELLVEGPGIETVKIFARTEAGEKIELPQERRAPQLGSYTYYPAELLHLAGPSAPILGVVRDGKSKTPLSGVIVKSQRRHGHLTNGWGEDFVRGVTDDQGGYRLEGMPIGTDNRIAAIGPVGKTPYVSLSAHAPTSGQNKPLVVNFELPSGVWIEGRITDKQTGKGLSGALQYFVQKDSPSAAMAGSLDVDERDVLQSDNQGRFRLVALPGPGLVTFMDDGFEKYPRADSILKLDGSRQKATRIKTAYHYLNPENYQVIAEVDPSAGAERVVLNLELDGHMVVGRVIDQLGKPVADFSYSGRMSNFGTWIESTDDKFELAGYDPASPRRVYFAHPQRHLAATAVVSGDPPGDLVVKLESAGKVTGRLVDPDGAPLADYTLVSWSPGDQDLAWYQPISLPPNLAGLHDGEFETDKQGRFEIAPLVPGVEYRVNAFNRTSMMPDNGQLPKFMGPLDVVIQLQAGESKDLGDVRVADEVEFAAAAKAAIQNKLPQKGTPLNSAAGSKPQPAVRSGKITLPDGKPAVGAHVAIIALRTNHGRGGDLAPRGVVLAEGTTDDVGNYRLSFPADSANAVREAHLIARRDGFALAWQAVNLDADSSEVVLALRPEEPIRGRLVDIEGKPAAGVRLIVKALSQESAVETGSKTAISYQTEGENVPAAWLAPVVSDAEGRFSIRGVPVAQGVFLSSIATEQFAPQSLLLNTGAPEQRGERDGTYRSQVKNAKPSEELILPLAPAQWFEGQITFDDTGLPASHARLTIWASQQEQFGSMVSVSGQADAEGRYRVCPMPGVRFGINAYPPDGTPYLVRSTPISKGILWQAGDRVKHVDLKLPRGVLVGGKVIEAGTDKPVAGASIKYVPEESNNPNVADDILTGWQGIQVSDERGEFAFAVLPGPGRMLVHGQGNFVFREISDEELRRGRPGGKRNYAHAIERIDPALGAEPLELTFSLQPGAVVSGELVDEQGGRIDEALVISRLQISALNGSWRALDGPQPGGKFKLSGLGPDQEYPAYFLDPYRRLGATEVFLADSASRKVVLKPCGEARARFVDSKGEPLVRFDPILHMIVTPGVDQYDWDAAKLGKLAADEDGLANIDRTNYWSRVVTDEQGRITFPALIPGATYRLYKFEGGKIRSIKEFSVASGQQLDLGDIRVADEVKVTEAAKPARIPAEEQTVSGKITLASGRPAAGAHVAVVGTRIEAGQGSDLSPRGQVLAEATADETGNYRLSFKTVSSKTHCDMALIARQDGSAIAWRPLDLDEIATEAALTLVPEEPIRGKLVDIEGLPAAGVRLAIDAVLDKSAKEITLRQYLEFQCGDNVPAAWLQSVTSDAEGRFKVSGVTAGHGIRLATGGNDRIAPQSILLNTGAPEQRGTRDATYRPLVKNVPAGEEGVLPLAPAQWFEGLVTYEDTGRPAPFARLTIWSSQTQGGSMMNLAGQADAEGRYRICPYPGIRFGLSAYPPAGTPYLVRQTEGYPGIVWQPGDTVKQVDFKLPRGVLVRGTVTEKGTDAPVAGAAVQYIPESANNPNVADDILTGWQGIVLTNQQGKFEIAVLPGPGHVLVNGRQEKYILGATSDEELRRGKRGRQGGRWNYAHAVEQMNPGLDADPIELAVSLRPGVTITGRFVDEAGAKVRDVIVISDLHISPLSLTWRGQNPPTLVERFTLSGLDPRDDWKQEYTVYFLDPRGRLGATQVFRADNKETTVMLKPCGRASARFVDPKGAPHVGLEPIFQMIITPGVDEYEWLAFQRGAAAADADLVANIDPANYGGFPKSDEQGKLVFPALIPGAKYRLAVFKDGKRKVLKNFSVESGQQLDLGDFVLKLDR